MIKIEWKTCLKVGVALFFLFLCIHYWAYVSAVLGSVLKAAVPLLIGCVLAFIVNVLMSFYERHYFPRSKKRFVARSRRPICLTLAYLSFAAVLALVIWLVVPQFVSCVKLILDQLPAWIEEAIVVVSTWKFVPSDLKTALDSVDWVARINDLVDHFGGGIGNVVTIVVDAVMNVFSGVVTAFISIIFSVYLLSKKDRHKCQTRRVLVRYLPKKWGDRIQYVSSVLYENFRRYIVGQSTEALILGSLCTIGMFILRLPYAPMIGALIAVTAFIPIAGAYIGGGIGALMIFSESPLKALIFIIFLIILQQLENNLIYPRVVGSTMNLPPVLILAAITIGGGVLGIGGMILAVPLAASVYCLVRNDLNNEKERVSKGAEDTKNVSI